jgi:hypothetical protein
MRGPHDSHFSCVLIFRENLETRRVEFLVQDVVSTKNGAPGVKQTKFPGGNNRHNCAPEETPEITAQREALEETHLTVSPDYLWKIWEKLVPSDAGTPGQHIKYAFMTPFGECRGVLRDTPLVDNNDTMGAPYWLAVDELKTRLFHGHQMAFIAACERLEFM